MPYQTAAFGRETKNPLNLRQNSHSIPGSSWGLVRTVLLVPQSFAAPSQLSLLCLGYHAALVWMQLGVRAAARGHIRKRCN